MGDLRDELGRIGRSVLHRFDAQKRVLSFDEYLGLLVAHPGRHTRDAARYLRDCFDHFGTYELERPWGKITRFRLFDLAFEEGSGDGTRRRDHLIGHEAIQGAVYGILQNFAREGRPNRLVLLHGPNGSAKTTFVACLMRALEGYSASDEGALYRFSWIFPARPGRQGHRLRQPGRSAQERRELRPPARGAHRGEAPERAA